MNEYLFQLVYHHHHVAYQQNPCLQVSMDLMMAYPCQMVYHYHVAFLFYHDHAIQVFFLFYHHHHHHHHQHHHAFSWQKVHHQQLFQVFRLEFWMDLCYFNHHHRHLLQLRIWHSLNLNHHQIQLIIQRLLLFRIWHYWFFYHLFCVLVVLHPFYHLHPLVALWVANLYANHRRACARHLLAFSLLQAREFRFYPQFLSLISSKALSRECILALYRLCRLLSNYHLR